MSRLRRLWARIRARREKPAEAPRPTPCELGYHRDTVDMTGGYLLHLRCLDCDRVEVLGIVVRVTNKPRPHPWERDA